MFDEILVRSPVRKHRAPKGALRLSVRRIKPPEAWRVRKHRAPKGALRLARLRDIGVSESLVRKHRAPKGALRLLLISVQATQVKIGQKAPSAKRCIKTGQGE